MGGERKREREGRRGEVSEEALEPDNRVVGKLRVKCERAEGLPKMGKICQKSVLQSLYAVHLVASEEGRKKNFKRQLYSHFILYI